MHALTLRKFECTQPDDLLGQIWLMIMFFIMTFNILSASECTYADLCLYVQLVQRHLDTVNSQQTTI